MAKRRFLRGEPVDILEGREFTPARFVSMAYIKGKAVVSVEGRGLMCVDVNHILKVGEE